MDVRKVDILHYIPDTTSRSKEFKELANTEDIEFNRMYELAWKWFLNTFVYDTDLDGVERWEEMLNIRPYSTYTLEQRQTNILAKVNQLIPFTYRRLEEILNALCGVGTYEIVLDHHNYRFTVKLFEGAREVGNVNAMVAPIIPANLGIFQQLVRKWLVEAHVGIAEGRLGTIHVPLEQDGHWKYYNDIKVGLAELRQGERKIQIAKPEIPPSKFYTGNIRIKRWKVQVQSAKPDSFKLENRIGILTVKTNRKIIPCEKEVLNWT